MLPRNHPDRIQIAFDAPGGQCCLLLPVTLAQHLGLRESSIATSTWETRRGGRTRETSC